MRREHVEGIAARIDTAHRERRLLDPVSGRQPFGISDAYAVQAELTRLRLARGGRRIGWKLGYTSAAMREQMKVDEPNFGPLLDTMIVETGSPVPPELVQPRVEPEVAVRIGADLRPDAFLAALEVVDSVWRDYRFRLEDNTADGSSAAGVVLGPPLPELADVADLADLPVELIHNGESVASATAAAAMGHPLVALDWLVDELPRHGESLSPGDVVITGGLVAAVPLQPGDLVEARFGGDRHQGGVTVQVSRRAER